MLKPQEGSPGAAEDSRNAEVLPTKARFGPGAAELSICDQHSDLSTYLSLPQSLDVNCLPIPSKEKAAGRNVLINISFSPGVSPELTVLMASACRISAVPSSVSLASNKTSVFYTSELMSQPA